MKYWCVLFSLLVSFSAHAAISQIYTQAKQLLDAEDYLGFRIYVKKSYYLKMTYGEWYALKNLISAAGERSGFDLIPFWNARNAQGRSELDGKLFEVDKLLKQNKNEEAFALAQSVAEKMKILQKTRWDAGQQLPYIYHSMARALYQAGRYDEALKVYQWIGQKYPYFAQVLFEKMWAAFKAGRVDLALGAIASQRSAYFSKFLPPESYLVQTYLYHRLCREADQQQVVDEMHRYQDLLMKPDSNLPLVNDLNTLVLWRVANLPRSSSENLTVAPVAVREKEQNDIKATLKRVVESQRAKNLKNLKIVLVYQQLSNQPDTKQVLQPVERMKSRDDLLKQNLEVWPADSNEEWLDEMGKHVLIGESLCKSQK